MSTSIGLKCVKRILLGYFCVVKCLIFDISAYFFLLYWSLLIKFFDLYLPIYTSYTINYKNVFLIFFYMHRIPSLFIFCSTWIFKQKTLFLNTETNVFKCNKFDLFGSFRVRVRSKSSGKLVGPLVDFETRTRVSKCGLVANMLQSLQTPLWLLWQNLHRLLVDIFARDTHALLVDIHNVVSSGASFCHSVHALHAASAHTHALAYFFEESRTNLVKFHLGHRNRHAFVR